MTHQGCFPSTTYSPQCTHTLLCTHHNVLTDATAAPQHQHDTGSGWQSRCAGVSVHGGCGVACRVWRCWLAPYTPAPCTQLYTHTDQLLANEGSWSLIAPTDAAFFTSLQSIGLNITRMLANTSLVLDIVDKHIVQIKVMSWGAIVLG